MVKAWVFHDDGTDQREEHKTNPLQPVTLQQLSGLGVKYWWIPVGDHEAPIQRIREQRGYINSDVIEVSKDKLPNYEDKIRMFFEEHLHEDEEVRYILAGSGYFDVRDGDRWIRVLLEASDLLVFPAGIWHRFTLDTNNYIKAMRLFQEAPKWTPLNRSNPPSCTVEARKKYEKFLQLQESRANGSAFILNKRAKALAHYPHLRRCNGMLYVSGTSSRRPNNTHVGATLREDGLWDLNMAAQTKAVFENIKVILNTAGADLDHCVQFTVFLTDFEQFPAFNKVYNQYFDAETGPTRTTVAVKQLPHPNLLIEIQAIAVDPHA